MRVDVGERVGGNTPCRTGRSAHRGGRRAYRGTDPPCRTGRSAHRGGRRVPDGTAIVILIAARSIRISPTSLKSGWFRRRPRGTGHPLQAGSSGWRALA